MATAWGWLSGASYAEGFDHIVVAVDRARPSSGIAGELGLVIKTRAERFSNHYRGPGVRETEVISYDFKP
jgi:hypothetical protein